MRKGITQRLLAVATATRVFDMFDMFAMTRRRSGHMHSMYSSKAEIRPYGRQRGCQAQLGFIPAAHLFVDDAT